MTFTDPISNMLTSIRNSNLRGYRTVIFPYSSFKWRICQKLKDNNFFTQCWIDEKNKKIKADIKYFNDYSNIHQIKIISKPSQHIHWQVPEIKKNCHGRSIYFISTSQGLLTHHEAVTKNLGGKVIFSIS